MNCNISTGLKGKQICVSIVLCVFSMDAVFFVGWIVWLLQSADPFNRCLSFCWFFFEILFSFPRLIRIKSNTIKLDKTHFDQKRMKNPTFFCWIIMQLENFEINFRLFSILYVWLCDFHAFALNLTTHMLRCRSAFVRACACASINVLELGSS